MTKRAFDIAASFAGLFVLWPFVGLLILIVRMTSAGPGLFSQTRIGRNGAPFTCHKLRTMQSGTPDRPTHETSASFVTPLGRFLRRTKLDEYPQLYDVLVGTMSFVGPRPCLPSQTELIRLRAERGVLAVRPGITGLAQIRGIDMSEPMRLAEIDADYVRRGSFLLDLRILLATVLTAAGFGDSIRS